MAKETIPDIVNAATGEIIGPSDVDGLLAVLRQALDVKQAAETTIYNVRLALTALAPEGNQKTKRLRGHESRCVLTQPYSGWDQTILKEAWEAYPKFRAGLLSIATIRVSLRELDKIKREKGPPDFMTFRKMILKAEKPSMQPCYVKFESDNPNEAFTQPDEE
jgi:hypothetical protein